MKKEDIKISFNGMDPTDALKDYAAEKVSKHPNLLKKATSMDIILTEKVPHRGTKRDFRIDINVSVPNSFLHVEEIGDDMYAIIDKASDILFRRFKRYSDKLTQWQGQSPWEAEYYESQFEIQETIIEDETAYDYSSYVPKIAVRKKLKTLRPMEEAEAIEFMELMGYSQLMFKNKSSGKISMIYKRDRGGYGLVEPPDEI
ncbi:ribosome-associated translation inhibitor RaiA [Candidatus Dojkabacteria bacterium]|nr:ribosome-associated translation inhibitor RaiA [Candidatus Dojkabacteria bacterium]